MYAVLEPHSYFITRPKHVTNTMATVMSLPPELDYIRTKALNALKDVQPAGPPRSSAESKALMLSAQTDGGHSLPAYYLVYFLLVDLLGYEDLGKWEKIAWVIPIRYQERLYSIEYRKLRPGRPRRPAAGIRR